MFIHVLSPPAGAFPAGPLKLAMRLPTDNRKLPDSSEWSHPRRDYCRFGAISGISTLMPLRAATGNEPDELGIHRPSDGQAPGVTTIAPRGRKMSRKAGRQTGEYPADPIVALCGAMPLLC
jgi:hypothetical protein